MLQKITLFRPRTADISMEMLFPTSPIGKLDLLDGGRLANVGQLDGNGGCMKVLGCGGASLYMPLVTHGPAD